VQPAPQPKLAPSRAPAVDRGRLAGEALRTAPALALSLRSRWGLSPDRRQNPRRPSTPLGGTAAEHPPPSL